MRIEGFLSLMACAVLLFILGLGFGALMHELRVMVPDAAPASPPPQQPAAAPR